MSWILIQKKEESQTLYQFAPDAFKLLNVTEFQERDSSHYIEHAYFMAKAMGFKAKIYYLDDQRYTEYAFCVHLSVDPPPKHDPAYLEEHADQIARLLARHDYTVAVPRNFIKEDSGRDALIYRRNPTWDAHTMKLEEEINTEELEEPPNKSL